MNIDRHVNAHLDFDHLVTGDWRFTLKYREFYNEYRSVMDLTAKFFLDTVDTVFVKHALPKGKMKHRVMPVDLAAIRRVGLLTVEGENDDISGIGQTLAAQDLCKTLPQSMKANYLQKKVGHYGVFNGSRFRNEIVPRIREFHAGISSPVRTLKLVAMAETS